MRTTTRIALFLLMAAAAFSQVVSSITGIVTDENGAVVPNVRVDATNVDTNARYVGRSSATGYFVIEVPAGTFELTAMQTGFKKFSQKGLEVSSGVSVRADVKLIKADWQPPTPIPPVAAAPRTVPGTEAAFAKSNG
jgi:Carboxypeptidase regulatory-like domain